MKTKSLAIALVLAGLWSCNEEPAAKPAPPPPPPQPKEFTPPADGLLQPERAARWRQTDSLVRILDSVFQDSMRSHPDRIAAIQAQQDAAREIAARKANLLGWKEYRWILEEAPKNPANAAAFQAAGLSMATTESKAGAKPAEAKADPKKGDSRKGR
ncbi:MAG: hypothetical protein IPN71_04550 [Fibrobacteres bacterium]|nr:hypothetical protein [Fibrobacterota bacterium]